MRVLIALTGVVSLTISLQASEWSARQEQGRAALLQRDYNGAAQIFEECVSLSENEYERAESLGAYGIALGRAQRNTEAKDALQQAIALNSEDRSQIAGALASVERALGDYAGAEHIFRATIADPATTEANRVLLRVNLADLLREMARENEAEVVLNEANRTSNASHQQRISILIEKAELTRDQRRWDESIALWKDVGNLAEREHSTQLESAYAGGLGETWFSMGNYARAAPLLRRSLELLRSDPATPQPQLATALSLMARLYVQEDKLALAQQALDEAVAKEEDALGREHPQVAILMELSASIQSRRGDENEARKDLERARSIMADHFGPDSTAVAGVCVGLGEVEQRAHHPAAAVANYRAALEMLHRKGTDSVKLTTAIISRYAAALKAMHKSDEAKALLAHGASSLLEP